MQRGLETRMPIEVDHDVIVSASGDLSGVLHFEGRESGTSSAQELEAMHHALIRACNNVPGGYAIHQLSWVTEQKHHYSIDENTSMLERSSELHFNERAYYQVDSYFILTKQIARSKPVTSAASNLLYPRLVPKETVAANSVKELHDVLSQFMQILSDAGLSVKRLTNLELLSDQNKAGLIERYCLMKTDVYETLVGDLVFDNWLQVGNRHLQIFTLTDADHLPTLSSPLITDDKYSTDKTKAVMAFATPLSLGIACDHILHVVIAKEASSGVIKALEKKKLRAQSLSAYSRGNSHTLQSINDYLNEAIAQGKNPCRFYVGITTIAESEMAMADQKKAVMTATAKIEAVAKLETVGAPQIHWALMPGNEGNFPVNDMVYSFMEIAACFFNLEVNAQTHRSIEGIRFGERGSGRPLTVDLTESPMKRGYITNRNQCIFGPSGSGKSFLTNHMMHSLYELMAHIVIVDIGHSYRNLCTLLDGYYFTYDEKKPLQFNPFYLSHGEILGTEKRESIKTLLLAL